MPHALRLECFEGPCKGTSFSRAEHLQTVGRTRTSKIWIKDPAVSEKHAELEWAGGVWILRDVGSSNGTRVNGVALDTAGIAAGSLPNTGHDNGVCTVRTGWLSCQVSQWSSKMATLCNLAMRPCVISR